MRAKTRQGHARDLLMAEGYKNAYDMPEKSFGQFLDRNRAITQLIIFEGRTCAHAGDLHGLSRERVRCVALGATRRTCGRYRLGEERFE